MLEEDAKAKCRKRVEEERLCEHPAEKRERLIERNRFPIGNHMVCQQCGCIDPPTRTRSQRVYMRWSRLWQRLRRNWFQRAYVRFSLLWQSLRRVDPRGPKGGKRCPLRSASRPITSKGVDGMRGRLVDASTVVFVAALLTAAGAAFAGYGSLSLARQQAAAERAMRVRVEELLAQVTGGDSLVYVEPLRKAGKVRYFVRQTGRHPSYDVVVRVQEVRPRGDGKKERLLLFGPAEVGRTLRRGSGFDWTYPDPTPADPRIWPLVFQEPPVPDASGRTFRLELAARNGIVVQVLKVWPVGGRWHTESKAIVGPGATPPALPDDFREAQQQEPNPSDFAPEDDLK